MNTDKLAALAKMIHDQTIERLGPNAYNPEHYARVTVKPGTKYARVDVGDSGKYMVDQAGNIWGIKGYGQVHKGHWYGTLDTIGSYYWGEYTARKIKLQAVNNDPRFDMLAYPDQFTAVAQVNS